MKKTLLTVLFSTACIAVGVEPVNLEWDANKASLSSEQFDNNAISIVFTLDFAKLTTSGGDIFKLFGHNGSFDTWNGMNHQYTSEYNPWGGGETIYSELVGINNGNINYGHLYYNLEGNSAATSADFAYTYSHTEAEGNLNITMYVYDNTGTQIDTKNFSTNITKSYLTNFTLLELVSSAIDKAEVYNKALQGNEIELAFQHLKGGEAPDSPTVPEPATATLSLLALAGLAARRRRK